jgi:hypothetical protein
MASWRSLSPIRRKAASAQPKTPIMPVGWKPTWWKPPLATEAMQAAVSTPITNAVTVALPEAPTWAAVESTAGRMLAVGWMMPATWVSSKSSPWYR